MKLFHRKSGHGHPLIILHGLFGSSDNWFSLAKIFAQHFTVYLVDQRNHGQSPQSDDFNYQLLTDDLAEFIQEHNIPEENSHILKQKQKHSTKQKEQTLITPSKSLLKHIHLQTAIEILNKIIIIS